VLASHDLGSLKTYCNRAVLLEAGSIVADGSVDQVWQQYIDGVAASSAAPPVAPPELDEAMGLANLSPVGILSADISG
jgi:ABC-type uncharacterized transport system ATPase subunit